MNFLFINNDWIAILPELFLAISINLILVYAVIYCTSPIFDFPLLINNVSWLSIQILFIAFLLNINNFYCDVAIFNNLLIIDSFGNLIKSIILTSTICILLMSLKYNRFELINNFEFPILIILTILGTLLLISSYDLIAMYLAIELQSFCSYILSAFKRNSEFSAEAGLKYFVLGAFSSGFLLFGCSLIYGFTGTTSYEQISLILVGTSYNHFNNNGIVIGTIFILISFLFKISAAPFHLWSPDIYEGSPTTVTAFFAIVPKIGLLAFFLRLFFDCLYTLFVPWQNILLIASVTSMIIGSFGAIWQIKLKRLLAFSAIGHVGYMLIGLCCCSIESIYALIFYSVIYICMSISSFSLLLIVRKNDNLKKLKYIEDLIVIAKTNPFIGLCLAITFFSIAGVPPLAGFFSKMFLFFSAISQSAYTLSVIGVLTSVVSCFYYLRVIQVSYFELNDEWVTLKKPNKEISILISILTLILIVFFLHPSFLTLLIHNSIINLCI
uniref:NADH dehydrogenase subunit 2 n=1 Tax=Cryptomonas curvata TaxID=233186 RepID=A0A2P1G8G8_9CRYP|nr:NADH dehydrogenase subunit 2 [Cryptomonas curvata]AVM81250.1 NADH dehydrogenase subunit 2 [Cryptomonas curvata]